MKSLLDVNGLNFTYDGGNSVFSDLNLNIYKGTLNAIIGANNCGKTTLIKILSGNLIVSSSRELENNENYQNYLKSCGVVYCGSNRKLKFDRVKLLLEYQMRSNGYSLKECRDRLSYVDNIFKIRNLLPKKVSKLCLLDKTKILIIAAIIYNPKILFIDDAFSGLNNEESSVILRILKTIIKELDITVVFTTMRVDYCIDCDNIYFLNDGKLECYENFSSIIKHDNMLARNGIIIPTMLDLSLKLKDYDLLDGVILEPSRMVDTLWKK